MDNYVELEERDIKKIYDVIIENNNNLYMVVKAINDEIDIKKLVKYSLLEKKDFLTALNIVDCVNKIINAPINIRNKKDEITLLIAEYIINNKVSIREAAKEFHFSKSKVHELLRDNLKDVYLAYYNIIDIIMQYNKLESFNTDRYKDIK